ncbi:chitobiase/beta-hexosaminidase C-terminal domain-containing protein [Algoriphagus sp. H41]|uniref:Chitobiase/beta-hexosaminidase C-terminal domain-containing protein n=1 Tax=Algoriphagus oliviformis TaxID=2811231 RepID=A0ABS3C105_9BACT|nr:c-type cytochrome domain-containing protein [Algoriphagus oliviformis]MBN7810602.1 chitobiase/beta-hexosaminidase C-terminal domain-containing protein [Algoriphagus oliviformis]
MPKVSRIAAILENLLFFWLGLALILSVAGESLSIPPILQVLGRAHPLILHFPIVLLLMAVVLLWVKDAKLRELGTWTLLLGANLTGLTVLAGLLLANEDYDGDMLVWHQWLGVASLGLAVLIYFYRNKSTQFVKFSTASLALVITLTGHFGADLTHGENFLLAPIQSEEVEFVALDDAEVFQHMVKPILEAKCVACHKEGKVKGELRLDDLAGMQKGGKNGPFVVPGDLKESLLIQRIHLPEESKEHMPPKNKAQLTEEELEILQLWVESGSSFDQKVAELPKETPLFQLASNRFSNQKNYTFDAASDSDIADLNNFFRKVNPVFPGSPALEVAYYGTSAFDPASLKELKSIKAQVVKLNLNRMPLEGVDLAFLRDFPHLEELQLNFTGVQASQLANLEPLESLRNLALSGNQLGADAVEALGKLSQVKRLFLWNSGLDKESQDRLQQALSSAHIDFGFDGKGVIYPLNSPKVSYDKVFFQDSMELILSHPIRKAEIRYTLDGTEPDSLSSPIYTAPIWVKKTGEFRAKAFAADWIGSLPTKDVFFKAGIVPQSYRLAHEGNGRYKANGASSLFDHEKGKTTHGSGNWLGFNESPLELEIFLEKNNSPKEISISILLNETAYIFPPEKVEIWTGNQQNWQKIPETESTQSTKIEEARFGVLTFPLPETGFDQVKIRLKPISKLPSWHPGAGAKGWVFVDEILLN